jgi:hypothetical protein
MTSSQPLTTTGLAARRVGVTTLLVANMTPARTVVELEGIRRHGTIRRLNANSAATACLEAYETVRVDVRD